MPRFSQGEAEARCQPAVAHAQRDGAPWAGRELARRPRGCRAPWRGTANAWHGRDSPWGPVCAHAGVSPPAACGAPGRQGSQPRSPAGRILLPRRWHRGHRQALSQPSPAHRMPDPEILGSGRARQSPRCHAGTAPFISQGWRKEGDPGAPRTKAVLWPHAGERGVRKIQQEGTREEKAAPRAQQGSMDALMWPRLIPSTLSGRGMLRAGPCWVPVGLVLGAVVFPAGSGQDGCAAPRPCTLQGKRRGREGLCSARLSRHRAVTGRCPWLP